MSTANPLPTERRFDPEFYQVPDEVRLLDVTAELRRAQKAIDHLRKERGEALSQARRFEARDQRQVAIIQQDRATHFRQLAELRAELAEAKRAWPVDRNELESLRGQLKVEERTRVQAEAEARDYRSQLCEILAGEAGEDCPECDGYGGTGSRSEDSWNDCDAGCFDGRVPR